MISIIISSYQEHYYLQFQKNVAETIAVPYEIIQIHNPGLMGICEAYNKGLQKAKYDCLLFCHEDIMFNTNGWGVELVNIFVNNKDIGLVGIAGSKHISKFPAPWWEHGKENNVMNLKHGHKPEEEEIAYVGWDNATANIQDVAVIDGVFIGMRKSAGIRFNEQIKGFHNYDLSISVDFRSAGWRVVCTRNILLTHFSIGKLDNKWSKQVQNFYSLYYKKLPIIPVGMLSERAKRIDQQDARFIMNKLLKHKHFQLYLFFWKRSFYLNPMPVDVGKFLKSLTTKK